MIISMELMIHILVSLPVIVANGINTIMDVLCTESDCDHLGVKQPHLDLISRNGLGILSDPDYKLQVSIVFARMIMRTIDLRHEFSNWLNLFFDRNESQI